MPLAPQVTNPGSRGQNSRYYVADLPRRADGRRTDGTYSYSDDGLSWDRPDSHMPGLRNADEMDGWDPQAGPPPTTPAKPLLGSALRSGSARKPGATRGYSSDPMLARAEARVLPQLTGAAQSITDILLGRAERTTREINARTSAIQGQLGRYAGAGSRYYGAAAGNLEGLRSAISGAISGTGQALRADLGAKLAQIQAPSETPALQLGQAGQAAAAAQGALGTADIEQLRGIGAADDTFMGALPRLAQLAGDADRRAVLFKAGEELADQIGALYGKQPEMIQDALDAIARAEADARDDSFKRKQFKYKQQQDKLKNQQAAARQASQDAYRRSQIALSQGRLDESRRYHDMAAKLAAGRLSVSQYNAATSRINAETSRGRLGVSQGNQQIALDRLGLSRENLELAKQREARLRLGKNKGGFSAVAIKNMTADAFDTVKDAKEGIVDEDGNVILPPWNEEGGKRPREVLKDMIGHGIPFSIAVRAVARHYPPAKNWYKPQPQRAARPFRPAAADGGLLAPASFRSTHPTSNLSGYPAVDIMARAGTPVGAPVDGTIVRHGSAQGGEALYFQGDDGSMYWLGHIDGMAPVGTHVRRGQTIASISADHPRPHLHIGRRQ